jgi:hypothetical protein
LDGSEVMAGVGITGDAIGIVAKSCTITTRSSPIVDRLWTEAAPIQWVMIFIRR